jgi:hypothetical protein
MMYYVVSSVFSLFFGGIGAGAIFWILREWLTTRLRESIKAEYAVNLERLRADIAQQNSLRDSASGIFAAAHASAHKRRIEAVEKLWRTATRLNTEGPSIIEPIRHYSSDAERDLPNNKAVMDLLRDLSPLDVIGQVVKTSDDIESERPFVGEKLWQAYYVRRALIIKLIIKLFGAWKGRPFVPWREDGRVKELLSEVLLPDDLKALYGRRETTIDDVRVAVENEILRLCDEVLSGRTSASLGLEQVLDIARAVEESKPLK